MLHVPIGETSSSGRPTRVPSKMKGMVWLRLFVLLVLGRVLAAADVSLASGPGDNTFTFTTCCVLQLAVESLSIAIRDEIPLA